MVSKSSVIDIQVNDEQFQEYLASVREYRDLLQEAGAELQGSLEGVSDGGKERVKSLKEETKSRKALVAATRDASFEEGKGVDAQNKQNTRIKDRIRLLIDAGRHQKDNISAAMKFAKSPIGKIGIAGAAAAGVMKALNYAADLAHQGMDLRMQTRLSGMDAGHYTAWQRNLEPYDPSGVLLQHAVAATRDGAEAARLHAIGVDTSSGDVNKIMASLIPALREFRNSHKGAAEQQTFDGMGLGDLVDTGDILGRASAQEVAAIPGNVERNARSNYVSDATLGAHQEASLNVGRRHDEWMATKLNTLAPVVEGMTKGAEQAQEKLDDLALSASNAASSLNELTGGHGLLAAGIAATVGPSIVKKLGGAGISLGGKLLKGSAGKLAAGSVGRVVGGLVGAGLRVAGPLGAVVSALTPSDLGTGDTFDMSKGGPSGVHLVYPGGGDSGVRSTQSNSDEPIDFDKLTGAVAMQESHGNPNAVSHAGAQGLLQTMPDTFRGLGGHNPFDPKESWSIGRKYLRQLYGKYHDLDKTLAAYNWGPGNLDRDIRQRGENWRDGLKKETRDYIPRVMNNLQNNTIIRIENYSGQDLSVAARQGAVL